MISILTFLLLPLIGAINTNSFPDVLGSKEEKELLDKWKNKDFDARCKLIEHNLRLVAHIVKKYDNTKEEKDDLLSIGAYGLIKAVDSFNFDSNTKLATYASRCIENEILMHLRSNKKYKDTTSIYAKIGEDKEGNEIRLADVITDSSDNTLDKIIKEEHLNALKSSLNKLTKREYEILCRRFGLENHIVETQKQIAKSLGISRSYVSRIEKRALTKIYLELKK